MRIMKSNVIITQFKSGVVAHEKLGPMRIEHYNNFLNNRHELGPKAHT